MKKIHALLTGIGKYRDSPKLTLDAPARDVAEMEQLLREAAAQVGPSVTLNIAKLLDGEATFDRFTDTFRAHFAAAKAGDTCLFYYSGHGSYAPTPTELRGQEATNQLETLLLHDSRAADRSARDLYDKELRALIHGAVGGENSGIHFVVIADCCHAFGVAKGMAKKRSAPAASYNIDGTLSVKSLIGYAPEWMAGGQYRPPASPHVLLAACGEREESLEMSIGDDGQPRGVFTWALQKMLRERGGFGRSYRDLMGLAAMAVRSQADGQVPQVGYAGSPDILEKTFLDSFLAQPTEYVIARKASGEWVINAGSWLGMKPPGPGGRTVFLLKKEGPPREAWLSAVRGHESVVEGMTDADVENMPIAAELKSLPTASFAVAFSPDFGEGTLKNELKTAISAFPAKNFSLADSPAAAPFLIKKDSAGRFFLEKKDGSSMPFVRHAMPKYFIEQIEAIAKWETVRAIERPTAAGPGLGADEFSVELFGMDGAAISPAALTAAPGQPGFVFQKIEGPAAVVFSYKKNPAGSNPASFPPFLKCRVRVGGRRELWVGAVWLDERFGISDAHLPVKRFPKNSAQWLETTIKDRVFPVVPLTVHTEMMKILAAAGQTECTLWLKVFASTQFFQTAQLCQKPLSVIQDSATKDTEGDKPKPATECAWTVVTVPVRVKFG